MDKRTKRNESTVGSATRLARAIGDEMVGALRYGRMPATLRALPRAERERVVGAALTGAFLPAMQESGRDIGDVSMWRRFARLCGVSTVPVLGLVLATNAERRAWLAGRAR